MSVFILFFVFCSLLFVLCFCVPSVHVALLSLLLLLLEIQRRLTKKVDKKKLCV